jgi:hypothetical protein
MRFTLDTLFLYAERLKRVKAQQKKAAAWAAASLRPE